MQLLSIKKGRRGLINLNLSDGSVLHVYVDLVANFKLAKGMEIADKTLSEIQAAQRLIDARRAAYSYASYKMRTEAQVRQKLKQLEYVPEEINAAIDKLYELGMLDDAKFARIYSAAYILKKKAGKRALLMELRKKGVPSEIALNTAAELFEDLDEYDLAREAAEKKLRLISYKPPEKKETLLRNHLIRLGYKAETVKKIVKELLKPETV